MDILSSAISWSLRCDLGAEFYLWEFATAVAGALLGIDAFDQPNVQESKDNTRRLLAQFDKDGALPEDVPGVTRISLANGVGAEQEKALEKFSRPGAPARLHFHPAVSA